MKEVLASSMGVEKQTNGRVIPAGLDSFQNVSIQKSLVPRRGVSLNGTNREPLNKR